jgi:hypothetical protein
VAYASHEPTAADYWLEECFERAEDELWERAQDINQGRPLPDCFELNPNLVEKRAMELFHEGLERHEL